MSKSADVSLLLISGPVGVGKSTVADEVYETLKRQSISIALINLDELGYANVNNDDSYNTNLRFKNLQSIWPNYEYAGVTHVVVPWVVESEATLELFRDAIPGAHISVALLQASLPVLRRRLSNRLMGGDLAWHINRAEELSEQLQSNSFTGIVVNTDDVSICDVAGILIEAWNTDSE